MQHKRQLLTVLILTFAASSACAAIGDGKTEVARRYAQVAAAERTNQARPETKISDTERVRQVGEKACRETVNSATAIGETFRQISTEIVSMMVKTGEEFARQMEDSYLRRPPDRSSDK